MYMMNRGFILEANEVSITERGKLLKGDVFILFHKDKRNRFFYIQEIVRRKDNLILLTKQINSLTMVSKVQNENAQEHILQELHKGKCEVIFQSPEC